MANLLFVELVQKTMGHLIDGESNSCLTPKAGGITLVTDFSKNDSLPKVQPGCQKPFLLPGKPRLENCIALVNFELMLSSILC